MRKILDFTKPRRKLSNILFSSIYLFQQKNHVDYLFYIIKFFFYEKIICKEKKSCFASSPFLKDFTKTSYINACETRKTHKRDNNLVDKKKNIFKHRHTKQASNLRDRKNKLIQSSDCVFLYSCKVRTGTNQAVSLKNG